MFNITCNICGFRDSKLLFNRTNDTFGKQDIRKCNNCKVLFVHPMPNENCLSKHYDGHFFIEKFDYVESGKIWEKFYNLNISYIEKKIKKRKILEVGCGLGHFLNITKKRGWDARGVELSKFGADYARNKFNLEIYNGLLEDARFPDNCFDVVALWATLEHLTDPLKILKEAYRVSAPGGLIVLCVPNSNSIITKLYGMENTDMKHGEHLYHFPFKTLKFMLSRAGFCDIRRMIIFGGSFNDNLIQNIRQFTARILNIGSDIRLMAFKCTVPSEEGLK